MNRKNLRITIFILFASIALFSLSHIKGEATSKKYSLIIADEKGNYTFYDLNGTDGKAQIETTSKGNIMVPLWYMTKLIPDLSYQYNSKTKEATVTNKRNGKVIRFKKDSTNFTYYPDKNAKGTSKKMVYKMYLSKKTSSYMVPMSTLRYVMDSYNGCKYYKIEDMKRGGYDYFTL